MLDIFSSYCYKVYQVCLSTLRYVWIYIKLFPVDKAAFSIESYTLPPAAKVSKLVAINNKYRFIPQFGISSS
jgi:hypothetical protein